MAAAGGLFSAGSAGGHDQHRQRIVGCDCARRGRHQRFRAGRHQRADAVSRQGQAGRPAGSRRCSCCSTRRPMPSSPARAAASSALTDIEGKNLGVAEGDLSIRLWPAVAKQNGIKHQEREAEQHQRRGARADAVGRPDRCRDRILLSVGDQSEGPRRAGRRSGGAEIRRLWLRGLWFRCYRQSGAGGRQARGGEGISCGP